MSQQHTPEPWATEYRKQFDGNYSQQIFDTEGNLIATVAWYPVEIGPGHTVTNREANARRIVACVNACAETSTEDLEEISKHGTMTPVQAALEIAKQRDELLAAAEVIEINAEECLDWDDCTAMLVPIDSYHKLMEAIASVKGGA